MVLIRFENKANKPISSSSSETISSVVPNLIDLESKQASDEVAHSEGGSETKEKVNIQIQTDFFGDQYIT